jgi:hypothetical protein
MGWAYTSMTTDSVSEPSAIPRALADFPGLWRHVGSGTLSWSVFKMYDAHLYAAGEAFYPDGRFALELAYLRNLPANQIVAASGMEMERLASPDPEQLAEWVATLEALMPDVQEGQSLLVLFDGAAGVRFYHDDAYVGALESAAFGRAFSAIWLDSRARSASLRAALFGGNPP